jgi:DMSO reductase anchor subunit
MELLVTFALKSLLIAGVTLGLLHLLRGRSAAERSMVAHLGMLVLVLFPLGAMFLPQLAVHVPLLEAAPVEPAQLSVEPITATPALPAAEAFQQAVASEPWWPLLYGIPVALLLAGEYSNFPLLTALAFPVQYAGLIAERWFFFAQARHPQNLYYQVIS